RARARAGSGPPPARRRGRGRPEAPDETLRDFDARARPQSRTVERRGDELTEERCRPGRPRLELGMELRRDEPWVLGQLDDLDEAPLLERPADGKTGLDQHVPVGVVDLVAVPVPLGDHRFAAVDLARARVLGELDRLRAE